MNGGIFMPYIPSEKTDGKSQDRNVINAALEPVAKKAAGKIDRNLSLIPVYLDAFLAVARELKRFHYLNEHFPVSAAPETALAQAIYETGGKYGYEGAHLGELNYAITRFIQRVPQIKVAYGAWKDELRYWLYAATVEALTLAAAETNPWKIGIGGVFEDIKDEYKRRVNTAYEAAQIVKSGDCYDTPYYTRLVEVRDGLGELVGHQEIMLQRTPETVRVDVLPGKLVLHREGGKKF